MYNHTYIFSRNDAVFFEPLYGKSITIYVPKSDHLPCHMRRDKLPIAGVIFFLLCFIPLPVVIGVPLFILSIATFVLYGYMRIEEKEILALWSQSIRMQGTYCDQTTARQLSNVLSVDDVRDDVLDLAREVEKGNLRMSKFAETVQDIHKVYCYEHSYSRSEDIMEKYRKQAKAFKDMQQF